MPGRSRNSHDRGVCQADGCEKLIEANYLCAMHYQRIRANDPSRPECSVEGCERRALARGMCNTHYHCFMRTGNALPSHPQDGRGYLDAKGYRILHVNGVARKQHRVIMELILGRALRSDESVHHKNGIRDDNSVDNLELWTTQQPAGQRVTDKLTWCKEFIAQYENCASINECKGQLPLW